ncbi:phosphoglycerate kinase [Bacteroidales bacterium OttesenSCG-928-B11]|nr:phosphoglycerate kinase [Bacteroidales bacterium OttesenSCG-928-E04]MDL2312597.1 phosphoglycerate kinase [Bacteroidales bacterium OttesenSCG-928-B11]
MKSIDQVNFKGKRALVRVDYNVPMDDKLQVTSTTRIDRTYETVKKITNEGGIAILMSHLGRPKGQVVDSMSLKHIIPAVEKVMGQSVIFLGDVLDSDIEAKVAALKPGDIALLENLRFHAEEEKGDVIFAEKLSKLGDIYVNDAFGTAHRAHASTTIVAQFFPHNAYAGYLLYNEDASLSKALSHPQRPFTAIIGGAKVSSKISIIENLLDKVDNLIITGGMCYTFLKAFGEEIGESLVEEDMLATASEIVKKAYLKGVNLYLPSDSVCGDKFAENANVTISDNNAIPKGWMGLDIGPKTVKKFAAVLQQSNTILWNGPAGVFEMKPFASGTKAMGISVGAATLAGAYSLVGGGDTITAVKQFNLQDVVSYISTGGGAMLEYLEGKVLPGIEALEKNKNG